MLALTVAIPASEVDQLPDALAPVEVKVVVAFTHMAWVPLSVPATGTAVTVTVRVAVTAPQPPLPATV
ncbi:hypothetical protein D3C80_1693470 [compost metagenome]